MKKRLKRSSFLTILTFAIFIVGIWQFIRINQVMDKHFDVQAKLNDIRSETPKVFEHIREKLVDIVNEGGIQGAIDLTKVAFRQEAITMYQCHTLAHMIGHSSVLSISKNIDLLREVGVDFCEGGFKHGLEAEIALKGLRAGYNFRPELYEFCSSLLKVSSVGDCYHGAGHEFMRETMDPKKAIELCDTLKGGPINTVANCYTGLFSEFTNMLGGLDGETGYELTTGPSKSIETSPIDFCASTFDEQHQIPCMLEIGGFRNARHSSPEELEKALLKCVANKYKIPLQAACLKSVAAVSTQHALPDLPTITPPKSILALPSDLRRAYILGAGGEMSEFIKNGQQRDWQTFCNAFPKDDREFCRQIFGASP